MVTSYFVQAIEKQYPQDTIKQVEVAQAIYKRFTPANSSHLMTDVSPSNKTARNDCPRATNFSTRTPRRSTPANARGAT
jgi:hypothetical protein